MDQICVLYGKYIWTFSLFMKNEKLRRYSVLFVSLNQWNKVFYGSSQHVIIVDIFGTNQRVIIVDIIWS